MLTVLTRNVRTRTKFSSSRRSAVVVRIPTMAATKRAKKTIHTRLKTTELVYDWKERPETEELKRELRKFGVFVYDSPGCEGTDSYGFVFSNKKLTKEELRKKYGW